MTQYRVLPGPEHFPATGRSFDGDLSSQPWRSSYINGVIVPEEKAYEEAARQFLMAQVPTIFPWPASFCGHGTKRRPKGRGSSKPL